MCWQSSPRPGGSLPQLFRFYAGTIGVASFQVRRVTAQAFPASTTHQNQTRSLGGFIIFNASGPHWNYCGWPQRCRDGAGHDALRSHLQDYGSPKPQPQQVYSELTGASNERNNCQESHLREVVEMRSAGSEFCSISSSDLTWRSTPNIRSIPRSIPTCRRIC
jgi:hypothetical protein